jgi:integrase
MQKSSSKPPKMGNNGGTAFVRINGKRIYLGKFGSSEANQNYARCIAEWATADDHPNISVGGISLDSLAIAFLDYIKKYDTSHHSSHCSAVRVLLEIYTGIQAETFTPKRLAVVQQRLSQQVDRHGKPYSRQYCNTLVGYIRRMFRWGVAQELVSSSTADALKYVTALRQGQTTAPDTKPRENVPDRVVNATLPHLLPTLAAMVQVQRLAAMRPNEIYRMNVGDIDMSGDVWIYCPSKHKGTWRGHSRTIALGKPEQALILPYLAGKSPEQAVFSPMGTRSEKRIRDAKCRKTKVVPSQVERVERIAEHPKLKLNEHYNAASYGKAIRRSIEKANVPCRNVQFMLRHKCLYSFFVQKSVTNKISNRILNVCKNIGISNKRQDRTGLY